MQTKCPQCGAFEGRQLLSQHEDRPALATADRVPVQMMSYVCDCGCYFVDREPLPPKKERSDKS